MAKKKKKKKLKIKIKPSKRGSFTAWCKRQGFSGPNSSCVAKGLRSKNPSIRRKANFSRNAKKWSKKR